jgi:hypothetical protein
LKTGAFLVSDPPEASRKKHWGASGSWRTPALSADGRTVVDAKGKRVLDVETGRTLWSYAGMETTFDLERNVAQVYHAWQDYRFPGLWNDWIGARLPAMKLDGGFFSVIDVRTQAVLYHCDRSALPTSPNGKWQCVDGEIRRLPPRVRWSLLVGVQAALAVPLLAVHLFAAVKRRRAVPLG